MTRKRSFRKSRFGNLRDNSIRQPHSNTIVNGAAAAPSNPMIFLPNSGGYVDPSIKLVSDLLSAFSKMTTDTTEAAVVNPCKEIVDELSKLKMSNTDTIDLLKEILSRLNNLRQIPEVKDNPEIKKQLDIILKAADRMQELNSPIGVAIPKLTSMTADVSPTVTQTTQTPQLLLDDLNKMDESEFKKNKVKIEIEKEEDAPLKKDSKITIDHEPSTTMSGESRKLCDAEFFEKLLNRDTYLKIRLSYNENKKPFNQFFNYLKYLIKNEIFNPFDKNNKGEQLYNGNDEFFKEIQKKDSKSIKDRLSDPRTQCDESVKNAITNYIKKLEFSHSISSFNDYDKYKPDYDLMVESISPTTTRFGKLKKKSLKKRKKKV